MDDEEGLKCVTLHCADHAKILTEGLWNFLQSKRGTDFGMCWAGETAMAHRLVLEVFLPPEKVAAVKLEPLDHHDDLELIADQNESVGGNLNNLLKFLYRGTVTVRVDDLEGLREMALGLDCWMLADAVDEAVDFGIRAEVKPTRSRTRRSPAGRPAASTTSRVRTIRSGSGRRTLAAMVRTRVAAKSKMKPISESEESSCEEEDEEDDPTDKSYAPDEIGESSKSSKRRNIRLVGRKLSPPAVDSTKETTESKKRPNIESKESCREEDVECDDPAENSFVHDRADENCESEGDEGDCQNPEDSEVTAGVTDSRESLKMDTQSASSVPFPLSDCSPPYRKRKTATVQTCPTCGYETVRLVQFRLHLATHDPSIAVFRCRVCSRRFLSQEKLDRHLPLHDKDANGRVRCRSKVAIHRCHYCSYETRHPNQLRLHEASKHDTSIELFRCPKCSRRFLLREQMERHVVKHSEKTVASHAEKHALRRNREAALCCPHCSYKTLRKSQMELHATKHDPSIKIFRCNKCVSTRFLTEEALKKHRETHSNEPEVFACKDCPYTTPVSHWFEIHLATHDPNLVGHTKCEQCSRRFPNAERLAEHREKHHSGVEDVYKCKHCKFTSTSRRSYHQHQIVIHQINAKGEAVAKRFQCPDCDYSCVYSGGFRYHVRTKHSTEKPFKCELCPYASSRKGDIGVHVKAVHINLKPFMCETCGQRCASQSMLNQHHRTHTGEKPFKCEECGKAFSERHSLKTHSLLHGDNARPYICHMCGHAFSRQDNLRVHLKNVHKLAMEPGPRSRKRSSLPDDTVCN